MSTAWKVAFVLTCVLGSGCHARFKKAAAGLGEVRPQLVMTGGPAVRLGHVVDDGLVGAIVNIAQDVKGAEVAQRIANNVDVEGVNEAFRAGLADTLGAGPPFGLTEDKTAPVMQVEILSYGLDVPQLGAPGSFTYTIRVGIYEPDGRRVYKTVRSCSTGVGNPSPTAQALLVVNNVKQLDEMSNKALQSAFESAGYYCGMELVTKMRKHANPGMAAPSLRLSAFDSPNWGNQ